MHHGLLLKYFFCDLTESPSGLGFGTLKALEIVYEQKKFFENTNLGYHATYKLVFTICVISNITILSVLLQKFCTLKFLADTSHKPLPLLGSGQFSKFCFLLCLEPYRYQKKVLTKLI